LAPPPLSIVEEQLYRNGRMSVREHYIMTVVSLVARVWYKHWFVRHSQDEVSLLVCGGCCTVYARSCCIAADWPVVYTSADNRPPVIKLIGEANHSLNDQVSVPPPRPWHAPAPYDKPGARPNELVTNVSPMTALDI
jgi:hypothetical protein